MAFQSVCQGTTPPKINLSSPRLFSYQILSRSHLGLRHQKPKLGIVSNVFTPCLKNGFTGFSFPSLNRGRVACASSGSNSDADTKLKLSGRESSGPPGNVFDAVEPFRGKAGCVSFNGLTHQSVEEAKLVSAPVNENHGSFLWLLGPIALIALLILPQFFIGNAIEAFFKDEVLIEMVAALSFEALFYIGVAIFLNVTDKIQRPYLQFSAKRWGLITGLRGYLTSVFFTMGFKVLAPIFAVYATWPMLGLPALVAVIPFLLSCAAQLAFESHLDKRGSSCWPLVPIIFEVYRLYQLTKATHFIEKLIFSMRGLPQSAQLLERSSAFVAMIMTFQILGIVCLWSLLTFLLRLFPSRPVAENY